jgi:hypothetical protein
LIDLTHRSEKIDPDSPTQNNKLMKVNLSDDDDAANPAINPVHASRTSLPPPSSRSHFTPHCLAPQIDQMISCGNAQYSTV